MTEIVAIIVVLVVIGAAMYQLGFRNGFRRGCLLNYAELHRDEILDEIGR